MAEEKIRWSSAVFVVLVVQWEQQSTLTGFSPFTRHCISQLLAQKCFVTNHLNKQCPKTIISLPGSAGRLNLADTGSAGLHHLSGEWLGRLRRFCSVPCASHPPPGTWHAFLMAMAETLESKHEAWAQSRHVVTSFHSVGRSPPCGLGRDTGEPCKVSGCRIGANKVIPQALWVNLLNSSLSRASELGTIPAPFL